MVLLPGISIVPVQLIVDDVLPGVSRFAPLQCYGRLSYVRGAQVARLAGNSLLGLDVDGWTERAGPDRGESLHADGVDGVRCQFTDRSQLVVVHHLGFPLVHWELWVCGVVDLVALCEETSQLGAGGVGSGKLASI